MYRKPSYKNKNLDRLYLNNYDLPHLPLFEGEEFLKLLSLENNLITKIDHLVSLNSLLYLNFYSNKITEIENLQNVSKLKALMLGKNNIEKIKNLSCLQDLEVLDLHSNKIRVIENLTNLKKLRLLNLANNLITNFNDLCYNKVIEELNLRKNTINSIPNNISNLDRLKKLNLGKNVINSLDNLSELKKLKSLSEIILEENPFLNFKESQEILKTLPLRFKSKTNPLNNDTSQMQTIPLNHSTLPNKKNSQNNVMISKNTDKTNTINSSFNNLGNGNGNGINIYSNYNSNYGIQNKDDKKSRGLEKIKLNPLSSSSTIKYGSNNLTSSINNHTNNNNSNSGMIHLGVNNNSNKSGLINFSNNVRKTSVNFNINTSNLNNSNIINNTSLNEKILGKNDKSDKGLDKIIFHIKKEWVDEYNFILSNGNNGYIAKRLKETKMISGHAELEDNTKLNIYGNALKVLGQDEFYNSVELISFNYFNTDLIINKKILDKIKNYKRLKRIIFQNNNMHSFYQLIKFEEINNLENITIIDNEICKSNLLKYFLIYRFQTLKFVRIFNNF